MQGVERLNSDVEDSLQQAFCGNIRPNQRFLYDKIQHYVTFAVIHPNTN